MIHTDGKPTIANTRLVLHKNVNPNSKCGGLVADGRELFGEDYWCVYCGAKWSNDTCPCAECSERCPVCGETGYSNPSECNYCQSENPDPDSAPGGYDNPREPYDWKDDA